MNIGGLYSYPRAAKELRILTTEGIIINGFSKEQRVQAGEPFVVLEESNSVIGSRVHLKILTISGIVGWIAYIDKYELKEVNQ
jgi:hypothetical protein